MNDTMTHTPDPEDPTPRRGLAEYPINQDRANTVLRALLEKGPMTADEFVTRSGVYVNSWAPTFTKLRKHGLVARTGDKRATSHKASAHVVQITDEGRVAYEHATLGAGS